VIHTINPRLFPDQIAYIPTREDKILFYDPTFAPLVEKLRPQLKSIKAFIAMSDPYATHKKRIGFVSVAGFDERTAACSATPRARPQPERRALRHRSTMIHAYAARWPDTLTSRRRSGAAGGADVPRHAWSLPYSCANVGAKMGCFPVCHLDGKSVYELFESER